MAKLIISYVYPDGTQRTEEKDIVDFISEMSREAVMGSEVLEKEVEKDIKKLKEVKV